MKLLPPASVSRRAFTLLELLVVISIIAVLAGLLLPVTSSVMDNARKVQAKNTELQIVSAIKNFQTDYGVYPVTSGDSASNTQDVTYGANAPTAASLMDVLRADGFGNDPTLNPRRIVYLDMPTVKNTAKPANGIGNDGMPYDPWGGIYIIAIDSNYDNNISNPYSANAGFNPISTGVICWSLGKDKQGGQGSADKNAGTAKDDVISWQ